MQKRVLTMKEMDKWIACANRFGIDKRQIKLIDLVKRESYGKISVYPIDEMQAFKVASLLGRYGMKNGDLTPFTQKTIVN